MSISSRIESILFYKAAPMSVDELARILSVSKEEIVAGIAELETALSSRGIHLLRKADEVLLGTAPEASEQIESLVKEELSKDLGKAGLETLAIVLYRGPISRADIDYVRGVNSSFILRHLLVRGLVERIPHERDQRTFLYQPTFEILGHLGVVRIEDLPEYREVNNEVSALYDRRAQETAVAENSESNQAQTE